MSLIIIYTREGGDIELFITLVPKVFKTLLIVGLTTLGTFNVSTTNSNLEKG